jgi:hypothetical protein
MWGGRTQTRLLTIRQFNGVAMVQCGVVVTWLFIHGWKGGGVVVIMLCEVL